MDRERNELGQYVKDPKSLSRKQLAIRLPPEVLEVVQQRAKENGVSPTQQARQIIIDWADWATQKNTAA